MMKGFLTLLLLVLFPVLVLADVRINEFSPDETPQKIELYNTASIEADLSGWRLDDDGGNTYYTIPPDSIVYPHSCLVFSAGFNLNKSSPDTVRLFAPPRSATEEAELVDSFAYSHSPGTGLSYGRNPDGTGDWLAAVVSWGRNNSGGGDCLVFPTATPAPSPTSAPTLQLPTDTPSLASSKPQDYQNIYISEIMANPPSGSPEWIELYNGNERSADLAGWFVDDIPEGGSTPKKIALTVAAYGYASLDLSSSVFNNGGDEVRLLGPDKTVRDALEYGEASENKTLSRISWDSDGFCETEASKNAPNLPCTSSSSSSRASSASLSSSSPPAVSLKAPPPPAGKPPPASFSLPPAGQPQVLGATVTDAEPAAGNPALRIRHLSFLSASYSILTILSLLIKIRNAS